MHWGKVSHLIFNTLVKEFRSRMLIAFFVLTIIVILVINAAFDYIKGTDQMQMAFNMMMGSEIRVLYMVISVWSGFLATVFGVNAVRSDMDFQVIDQILAFPIYRFEYLVSRILGCWLMIVIYYLISIALGLTIFSLSSKSVTIDWTVMGAFGINSLSIFALILTGTLYSLFLPKMLAFIVALGSSFFVSLSNSYYGGMDMAQTFSDLSAYKLLGLIFHYLFPRMGVLNKLSSAVLTKDPIPYNVPLEMLHFVLSIALLGFITQQIFKQKEF